MNQKFIVLIKKFIKKSLFLLPINEKMNEILWKIDWKLIENFFLLQI